ncbi:uncharacterized protein LOC125582165 [Brassica napus]|uniref:uncharacterized protein LOC125582165 n=1 Tax=Brassica napus TaxID=3708 RepID=UPI0020789941|nr:uncharacterized protein LOC125582165 [Brassica napus]
MEVKIRVQASLGITKVGGVGKYLGLPEHFGRRKKDLFTSIVDSIRQRAASWSSKKLSSAGKLVMLKSVLSVKPTYAMTCFKLPLSLIKRIQSALTRFWWDANPDERKMCWVAFSELAKSKGEGGLGLRDIEMFNVALLAKQSWRIATNPECLLSRVLLGKYCNHQPLFSVSASSSISHGWRSILCGRDLLLANTGKAIGDCRDTSLWEEPWLSSETPTRPMGPPTDETKHWRVSDLISRESGEWNKALIERTLPHAVKEILSIKPSKLGKPDALVWLPTKYGTYNTKTGYYTALSMKETTHLRPAPPQPCNWNADIWRGLFSPKLRVFLWKIVKGALPLGENLEKRSILTTSKCIHCGLRETASHMFLHCRFATRVWAMAPLLHPELITSTPDFETALKNSKKITNLPPSGLASGPLAVTPEETLTRAIKLAREWQEAQCQVQSQTTTTPPLNVVHPIEITSRNNSGGTTICTDAAWKEESNRAGLGWIFTDHAGDTITSESRSETFVPSPLMAESLAIREALLHARQMGISTLKVKSDAQTLVRAINDRKLLKEMFGIFHDILKLSLQFHVISFVFIPRSDNIAADALAKEALLASDITLLSV